MRTKKPAQARDRLLETVVTNRHVLPSGLQQVVLGDDLAGTSNEQEKNVELPLGNRHGFSGGGQAASSRIKLEGFEDEARAGQHGRIVSTSDRASDILSDTGAAESENSGESGPSLRRLPRVE